jgi:hypothetical protein
MTKVPNSRLPYTKIRMSDNPRVGLNSNGTGTGSEVMPLDVPGGMVREVDVAVPGSEVRLPGG